MSDAPKGSPGDPISVAQTDRGTTDNPVVVQQTKDIPKGTVADPVVVKQEIDPNRTYGIPNILWQAIIAGIVTIAIAYMQSRTNSRIEKVQKTSEQTLVHVNSAMGTQLRANAVHLRMLSNDKPEYESAAAEAEKAYAEHMAGQAKVDAEKMK